MPRTKSKNPRSPMPTFEVEMDAMGVILDNLVDVGIFVSQEHARVFFLYGKKLSQDLLEHFGVTHGGNVEEGTKSGLRGRQFWKSTVKRDWAYAKRPSSKITAADIEILKIYNIRLVGKDYVMGSIQSYVFDQDEVITATKVLDTAVKAFGFTAQELVNIAGDPRSIGRGYSLLGAITKIVAMQLDRSAHGMKDVIKQALLNWKTSGVLAFEAGINEPWAPRFSTNVAGNVPVFAEEFSELLQSVQPPLAPEDLADLGSTSRFFPSGRNRFHFLRASYFIMTRDYDYIGHFPSFAEAVRRVALGEFVPGVKRSGIRRHFRQYELDFFIAYIRGMAPNKALSYNDLAKQISTCTPPETDGTRTAPAPRKAQDIRNFLYARVEIIQDLMIAENIDLSILFQRVIDEDGVSQLRSNNLFVSSQFDASIPPPFQIFEQTF